MSKIKKSISLALALLMLLSVFTVVPLSASAETYTNGDWDYEILDDGTAGIKGCSSSEESLTIPGKIDGKTVTKIYDLRTNKNLRSVTIPKSINYISNTAFDDTITSVKISDIAAWCNIEFGYYNHLDENFDYEYPKILYNAQLYLNDKPVTDLVIPQNVKEIKYHAFYGYRKLKSLTILGGATKISYGAFCGCTNLTSATIGKSVTNIGNGTICEYAFCGCTNLTSATIGKSVTSIECGAFFETAYYNNKSNWKNGVLYIDKHLIEAKNTLSGSYSIKKGTLVIADSAFWGCEDLDKITIPDSVTSIGNNAFQNCINIESIIIPKSVTNIGDSAFEHCENLEKIKIPKSVKSIGDDAFGRCFYLTIFGYKRSVAERYAKENKIKFVKLKKNPIKVKVAKKTVKLKKLKKKVQKVKPLTVKKAQGKVTYKLVKSGITKKIRKLVKINSKGVITIKKWKKAKKGTYKIKVKVTAADSMKYIDKTVTKTVKVKVK